MTSGLLTFKDGDEFRKFVGETIYDVEDCEQITNFIEYQLYGKPNKAKRAMRAVVGMVLGNKLKNEK